MARTTWDFDIERISLDDLGLDAGQRLRMVLVQPDYTLDADGAVPFRISATSRQDQGDLIERAFRIRAAESHDRGVPVPFILFPEAAIPVQNPDGLGCLRQQMEQAEGDVVFIGGLEGQSRDETQALVDRFPPAVDTARPDFDAGTFVNLCVIAVKWADGRLGWHFQAKLAPSQWEQRRSMARGRRVLYFLAPRLAFVCQICFDHVAAQGLEPLNVSLCQGLIQKTQPLAAPLNFVFVPQCNPKPQERCVRENTSLILNFEHPQLSNHMASVVMVNKAAAIQEPSEYGRSGFHYRAGRWQVQTKDVGPTGYELYDLNNVTSAVFRKRTQAIHVATYLPPSQNLGDPGNPRAPLENPRSYVITDTCDPTPCACLPGTACAAGTFVLCDCLPCKLRDTLITDLPVRDGQQRWKANDESPSKALAAGYDEIRAQVLGLGPARAGELLDLLFLTYEDKKANPDTWEEPRLGAVVELASALSVLREWMQPLGVETRKEWTALLGDSLVVVVVDGENRKRNWGELELAYQKAFGKRYSMPEMRQRTVLFVALRSQGQVEHAVKPSWLDFTVPRDRARLGNRQTVDEHDRLRFYVCQGGLLEEAREKLPVKDYLDSKAGCIRG